MEHLTRLPLPAIPAEIQAAIAAQEITLTPYEDRAALLSDGELRREVGVRRFPDGRWLVSMTCPMPGVTAEMIRWWFWWHTQDSRRYRLWYPGAHLSIRYARRDAAYFRGGFPAAFRANSQLPVEIIGGIPMPLRIDFTAPETFGFPPDAMAENGVPIIVCGHVSAFGGLLPHTEMAHIFHQTGDGLMLTSRFWLGQTMKNPLLRKMLMTEKTARGMAEHCCVEYRRLAQILPELHATYAGNGTN